MMLGGRQPSKLDETLDGEPVRQWRLGPVGPGDRQRHPPGRAALADEHQLRTGATPFQDDRHSLAGQRMERMGDNNRARNRALV
jgi:hypothetical protein